MAQLLRSWVSYRTDIVHVWPVWPGALALVNHVPVREVGNGLLLCVCLFICYMPHECKNKGTNQTEPAATENGAVGTREGRAGGGAAEDGGSAVWGQTEPRFAVVNTCQGRNTGLCT